jgi:hypothetical protein
MSGMIVVPHGIFKILHSIIYFSHQLENVGMKIYWAHQLTKKHWAITGTDHSIESHPFGLVIDVN